MLFRFMKKPEHKIFDYTPRFYDPMKDEKERRKRRFKFSQARKYDYKKRSPIAYLVVIGIIVLIYLKYFGYL